jgi:hypothetical protein
MITDRKSSVKRKHFVPRCKRNKRLGLSRRNLELSVSMMPMPPPRPSLLSFLARFAESSSTYPELLSTPWNVDLDFALDAARIWANVELSSFVVTGL